MKPRGPKEFYTGMKINSWEKGTGEVIENTGDSALVKWPDGSSELMSISQIRYGA